MYGYRDALTIKTIDDKIISEVENFVKNDLEGYLAEFEQSSPKERYDRATFFGNYYASKPSSFKLAPGEKAQIREMVAHVKGVADKHNKPNSGIKYFGEKKTREIHQPFTK